MKKLGFASAFVRHCAIAISRKDGGKTVRIDWTMNWTAPVRKALGFSELEEDQEDVDLKGELAVSVMALEAGGKSFNLGSGIMKTFKAVRVDDGKKPKVELRCQYTVTGLHGIAGMIEKHVEQTSRAKGELAIEYEYIEPDSKGGDKGGEQQELVDMTE